jgi:hypothetical protein
LKNRYINDTWNIIDVTKIVFTLIYILSKLIDTSLEEDDESLFAALAVLLNWMRLIGFFRALPKTRYYIRMIIETGKLSLPFLAIFLCFSLALTYSLMGLRGSNF